MASTSSPQSLSSSSLSCLNPDGTFRRKQMACKQKNKDKYKQAKRAEVAQVKEENKVVRDYITVEDDASTGGGGETSNKRPRVDNDLPPSRLLPEHHNHVMVLKGLVDGLTASNTTLTQQLRDAENQLKSCKSELLTALEENNVLHHTTVRFRASLEDALSADQVEHEEDVKKLNETISQQEKTIDWMAFQMKRLSTQLSKVNEMVKKDQGPRTRSGRV